MDSWRVGQMWTIDATCVNGLTKEQVIPGGATVTVIDPDGDETTPAVTIDNRGHPIALQLLTKPGDWLAIVEPNSPLVGSGRDEIFVLPKKAKG